MVGSGTGVTPGRRSGRQPDGGLGGQTDEAAVTGGCRACCYRSVNRTTVGARVVETLGARLRQLRLARDCSLSELARRSGIGKGTISELENDRRGARLDTLFALTTALDAPLGALLPDPDTRAGEAVRGDCVAAELLGRWPVGPHLVEVYRAVLGQAAQRSAPHAAGVEETVTVVRGRARVGCAGDERVLAAGESLRYPGDRPHRYQALDAPAEVVLLMHYPNAGPGGAESPAGDEGPDSPVGPAGPRTTRKGTPR